MNLRTATPADIPAMAELLHELFSIESDFTPDFAAQSRGLDLLLQKESCLAFVAEIKDQIVGMCTVQILVSTVEGCEVGAVEDFIVELEHRGKGIGSSLLRALEEWALERGLARLQLQADCENHLALGFYRSQGWQHTNLIGWMKHL